MQTRHAAQAWPWQTDTYFVFDDRATENGVVASEDILRDMEGSRRLGHPTTSHCEELVPNIWVSIVESSTTRLSHSALHDCAEGKLGTCRKFAQRPCLHVMLEMIDLLAAYFILAHQIVWVQHLNASHPNICSNPE
jgi:hypothetical protein